MAPESGDAPAIVAEGVVTVAGGQQVTIDLVPAGAQCLVWEPDARGLFSNAPDRASAVSVRIPVDGSVELGTAEIVNSEQPPTTTTTTDPGASTTTAATGGASGTTTTARASGNGILPSTGSGVSGLLAVAALFVVVGAVVALSRRRPRPA